MTFTQKDIMGLTLLARVKDFTPEKIKEIYSYFSKDGKLVANGLRTSTYKNKQVKKAVDLLIKFSKKTLPQRGKFCPCCGR